MTLAKIEKNRDQQRQGLGSQATGDRFSCQETWIACLWSQNARSNKTACKCNVCSIMSSELKSNYQNIIMHMLVKSINTVNPLFALTQPPLTHGTPRGFVASADPIDLRGRRGLASRNVILQINWSESNCHNFPRRLITRGDSVVFP